MRKLKLDPEALRVESFAVRGEAITLGGTVRAHGYTDDPNLGCSDPASERCQETDWYWFSCGDSCVNMCLPTGNDPRCIK
jgi:hypothetical protein